MSSNLTAVTNWMGKRSPLWFDLLAIALLCASTFFVYWDIQSHPFVLYDDAPYVYENPVVRQGLTWEGLRWAMTEGSIVGNWHPVTWFSHMLDCELFGIKNPGDHHRTSLIFHLINSVLIFLLLRWLTAMRWPAFWVAAVFALHPLHVESVAWVAERKDVLSQFFWLLSIGSYARYATASMKREPKRGWYLTTFVLVALGLMSKPMVVTAPFLFLLLDYWPLYRIHAPSDEAGAGKDRFQLKQDLLVEKIPFFLLIIGSSFCTVLAQQAGGAVSPYPLGHRLATVVTGYARYLEKFFWPVDLAVLYPNWIGMWSAGQIMGSALLLGVLTTWVLRNQHQRYLFVGWFWFLGTLVPVIGFYPVGLQSIADRYMYMPMLGLLVALVWGVEVYCRRSERVAIAASVAAGLACIALGGVSSNQVKVWSDSITLFRHAVSVTQNNHVMHNNLGNSLAEEGSLTEAAHHYREALRINPSDYRAHNNLGITYKNQGRLEEAMASYQRSLRYFPDYAEAHHNLGNAHYIRGDYPKAISSFRAATKNNPEDAEVHYNLGLALGISGDFTEAVASLQRSIALDPNNADAHSRLGLALASLQRLPEALDAYMEGLNYNSRSAPLLNSTGNTLRALGRPAEAIAYHRRALDIEPEDATAQNAMGISLATSGKTDQAIPYFREAVRLDPSFKSARENLSRALSAQPDR